jgi:GxxExxY protein
MNKSTWYNEISNTIIGAAIEVHRELGPGLLEAVYETCLMKELKARGINARNQVGIPIKYKGELLDRNLYVDVLVEDAIILELKSCDGISSIQEAQLLSYLRLADKKLGYLINFNVTLLKYGVHRYINGKLD